MRRYSFPIRPRRGPSHRFRPTVSGLEDRRLPATAVANLLITPSVLTPPNNRFVKVEVSGNILETATRIIPDVVFHVSDEYRRIEPSGRVILTGLSPTVYSFKFTITLQASRSSQDQDGRQYFVTVASTDRDGSQGHTLPVLVPQNALKPGQTILPYRVRHPAVPNKFLPPLSLPEKASPTSGLPNFGNLFGKK
jgi:hypothetical protein